MASLRRRLLVNLIGLFALAWLAALAATYATATRRIEALLDAELAQDAGALLTLMEAGAPDMSWEPAAARDVAPGTGNVQRVPAFVVWRAGRLALRSENAPVSQPAARIGYGSFDVGGRAWRGYTLRSADAGIDVWVGQPLSVRGRLVDEITRNQLFPLLLAIPLLAAVVWWGAGRGLLPLRRVEAEVAQRSPTNLQPLDLQQVPVEIRAVAERINALLARLGEAFDRERRFTADAAHEIRTPLAGIKVHAQVALRTPDDGQRRHAMEKVIDGVDRTARLVEQLLTLARLDRESLASHAMPLDLDSIAAETVSALGHEAAGKHITLTLGCDGRTAIQGDAAAVGVMLRNLIGNAICHTPPGGAVAVCVHRETDKTVVSVTDNGPGIPVDERARVFDRFYRGTTASSTGCGLGLSIARRVAELHRAAIELADTGSGTGLQVRVVFPGTGV